MVTTVVNIKTDKYDNYIGRAGRGKDGYFGNPFNLRDGREVCIQRYKSHFDCRIATDPEFKRRIEELKDTTIGCFCKPLACHGDIIKEYLDHRLQKEVSNDIFNLR